jgi:SAM-dependent methyltransferase
MYNDVIDLKNFYGSNLGQIARRLIRRKIRTIWPDVSGMSVMGLGYAIPYLRPFYNEADRVFALMPAQQGADNWPEEGPNLTVLSEDIELPLQNSSIDRILMVHSVECTEHLRSTLDEVWRVMTSNGRLLVVVPNRRGLWSRFERTPFGHGQPYSASQLSRMLRNNMFISNQISRALFVPPYHWRVIVRSAYGLEDLGSQWLNHLGGVVMIEASKQIYAPSKIKSVRNRDRRLMPSAVARVSALQKGNIQR